MPLPKLMGFAQEVVRMAGQHAEYYACCNNGVWVYVWSEDWPQKRWYVCAVEEDHRNLLAAASGFHNKIREGTAAVISQNELGLMATIHALTSGGKHEQP